MKSLYDFSAKRLDGTPQPLSDYRGKVSLVVNVASKCGFTRQYEGLEALWRSHGSRGLVVLGFPCNQFGSQEPGGATEIAQFCALTYQVSFPMFEKVEVNGSDASAIYNFLKANAPNGEHGDIEWNFTKFLVDREGKVVGRFASKVTPEEIAAPIEAIL